MLGEKLQVKLENCSIDFLKHASALISFGVKKIFIDPWQLPLNPPKADLILVTHEHYDHCDQNAINKISKPETIIVANEVCSAKIRGKIKILIVGESINLSGVEIFGVAAYNINKKFHPKGLVIGFVLELNGVRIYHAGDTDFIPEMNDLKNLNLDVAMLPMGGKFTMDANDAIQAANAIAAKITIPMHYKRILGDTYKEAEKKLKQGITNSQVVILQELQ